MPIFFAQSIALADAVIIYPTLSHRNSMIAEILFGLAVLLIAAKIFGEIAERLGVGALVGQIIAGVVVGPLLGIVVLNDFLKEFVGLGIVFILFHAGLGVKFEDIKQNLYTASGFALAGGLLSFALGFLVGFIFLHDVMVALVIGIIFISTGDAVIFTVLRRIGEMKTQRGKLIIATTAADDIVGILALSFFTYLFIQGTVNLQAVFQLFLIAIGFYLIMLTAGMRVIRYITDVLGFSTDEHILFAVPVAIAFLLAVVAENIGLGIATGAFIAGMAMAKSRFKDTIIVPKVSLLADGFVIPIFYALIGTFLVFSGIDIALIVFLTAAVILGKVVGVMALGKALGMRSDDTKMIGILMTPRGDYNLAVSQIALGLGMFSIYTGLYTSIVFSIILTIIITPVLLKAVIGKA